MHLLSTMLGETVEVDGANIPFDYDNKAMNRHIFVPGSTVWGTVEAIRQNEHGLFFLVAPQYVRWAAHKELEIEAGEGTCESRNFFEISATLCRPSRRPAPKEDENDAQEKA